MHSGTLLPEGKAVGAWCWPLTPI